VREADLLAELQKLQDLLAGMTGLSLGLLDTEGNELTIPSRLPADCIQPTVTCSGCSVRLTSLARSGSPGRAIAHRCPKGLYLLVIPTAYRLSPGRGVLLVCGRTDEPAGLDRHSDLFSCLAGLPLCADQRDRAGPAGSGEDVRAEVLQALLQHDLTPQEIRVLRLIGQGLSNKAIASRLYVSESTVKTHVTHLLRKLNQTNRTGLAIFALDQGLTDRGAIGEPDA